MIFLARFLTPKVLMILGYIGLAFSLFFGIKNMGRQAEKVDNLKKTLDSYKKAKEASNEVDSLNDDDVDKRLRKWYRK